MSNFLRLISVCSLQRWGRGSVTKTSDAPAACAVWIINNPIGPHPNTPTRIPVRTLPRSTAWMAIPKGSNMQPSELLMVLGIECRHCFGHAIHSRKCTILFSMSGETQRSTKIRISLSARFAFTAGYSRVYCHTLSGFSHTGKFMTKHQGFFRRESPIPASLNQCRSEPHNPTAVTRIKASSGRGFGTGSSTRRISPIENKRATFILFFLVLRKTHSRSLLMGSLFCRSRVTDQAAPGDSTRRSSAILS